VDIAATWPNSICVRLTRACNAACAFCQAPHTDEFALSMDELRSIANTLQLTSVRSVKLSGGEPTVRNDLADVISLFGESGFKVTVITNGVRVTDRVLAAMAAHNGKFKFSVHYPDKRNDLVLKNKSFSKIKNNAERVIAARIPLAVNSVVNQDTIGEMQGMVELAIKWKCQKVSFLPMVFRGLARNLADSNLMDDIIYRKTNEEVSDLKVKYSGIRVNLIDIRGKPYWIIDNDNTLFISGDVEERDIVLGRRGAWISALQNEVVRT
jgi:MoaA/NifB/PqqE/SkfB family radical SAM enzyme